MRAMDLSAWPPAWQERLLVDGQMTESRSWEDASELGHH